MKRLILLTALVVILAGLSASVVSDTSASRIDSSIPDNEITSSQAGASNSSASATSLGQNGPCYSDALHWVNQLSPTS